MKITVTPQWGEADQVYYIAYLIDRYLDPLSNFSYCPPQQEIKEFSSFTRKLILLSSGLASTELPTNEALADFIENFQQLYPHLFSQCPLWFHWLIDDLSESEA